MKKNSALIWAGPMMAILAVMCGCLTSQLEVDPSYSYVGGRTYTANMKKLQAYSKTTLPECTDNSSRYHVISENITDLDSPLKMIVFDESMGRRKGKRIEEWQLYLYHAVPNAAKGAEVQAVVLKSDAKRMDQLLRKEIIKYIKEGASTECKAWRDWVANTNYNALTSRAPIIMFGQEFSDMVRHDLQQPILKIRELNSFDLSNEIDTLRELGLIEVLGSAEVRFNHANREHNAKVQQVLANCLGRLAEMVSAASHQSFSQQREIIAEMSKRVATQKIALKKEIDEAAKRKLEEEARIAKERKLAEEQKRREEAARLQRQQVEDGRLLAEMDETVAIWKRTQKEGIAKICSADNVLDALVEFARGAGVPNVKLSEKLQLPQSIASATAKVQSWERVKGKNWELLSSNDSLERAKFIYGLESYCKLLDDKIWGLVLKRCEAEEEASFNKKFRKMEIPIAARAVDVTLASQFDRYMFNRPMEFVKGKMYELVEQPAFGDARIGALFDEGSRTYNVAVRIGAYMNPDGNPNRVEMIVISGLASDCVTGMSLSPDTKVIYRGPIQGKNGFGNTITARHFEIFDASELNLADVSEFDIAPGRKGVKIDDETFNYYFADVPLKISSVVTDGDGHTKTNSHIVVEDHKVGSSYIVRKNCELKTIIAREGKSVVGMFGVRLGVETKDLSESDVGVIGKPIPLPESEGGGLSFAYDYQGNRGIWDAFSFQTVGDNKQKINRVEASKSYSDESSALSDAHDFLELMRKRYGVPMAKNPLAKNGNVWIQIFEQPHDSVLMAVKVVEKAGKYLMTYSMLELPPKKETK